MAYVDITTVKAYQKITNNNDDALLTMLIANAQQEIDAYCRRTFEADRDTPRTFDAVDDVYGRILRLDTDLCQITAITNGDGTVLTTSQYVTEPRNETPYYEIRIRSDASVSWTYSTYHEDAISIVGRWAYSKVAPLDIKQATLRLVHYFYQQRAAPVFETTAFPDAGVIQIPSGIPVDVKRMLQPYRRLV